MDHAFPEVSELRVENGELVAVLGAYFAERSNVGSGERPEYRTTHPRLAMSAGGEWRRAGDGGYPEFWFATGKQCMDAPLDPEAAWPYSDQSSPYDPAWDAEFNQVIVSCTDDGVSRWGGITYYGDEGAWDVGGLVRKNIESGAVEFIRSAQMNKSSIGPIAYFAGRLWLGTAWFGECSGPPGGSGLKYLKYWEYSDIYALEEVPEVCGFAIRDFQEFRDALWVATDLGISKLTNAEDLRWDSFVPDLSSPVSDHLPTASMSNARCTRSA